MARTKRELVSDRWDDEPDSDDEQQQEQQPEPQSASELIVAPPGTSIIPTQKTPLINCPTSIPTTSFAGRALLLKCSTEPVIQLGEGTPLHIIARYWALIPGSTTDEETGEVSEYTKTVFVGTKGEVWVMTSAHGPRVLLAMLSLLTPEEWAEGVPLVIRARRSKRGRTYHDVQIDAGPIPSL